MYQSPVSTIRLGLTFNRIKFNTEQRQNKNTFHTKRVVLHWWTAHWVDAHV